MKGIYWRKLELEELIETGDILTLDDFRMDFDYAQTRHFQRTHREEPKLSLLSDMVGHTVSSLLRRYARDKHAAVWRPTVCAEANYSDPVNQERRIDLDL